MKRVRYGVFSGNPGVLPGVPGVFLAGERLSQELTQPVSVHLQEHSSSILGDLGVYSSIP